MPPIHAATMMDHSMDDQRRINQNDQDNKRESTATSAPVSQFRSYSRRRTIGRQRNSPSFLLVHILVLCYILCSTQPPSDPCKNQQGDTLFGWNYLVSGSAGGSSILLAHAQEIYEVAATETVINETSPSSTIVIHDLIPKNLRSRRAAQKQLNAALSNSETSLSPSTKKHSQSLTAILTKAAKKGIGGGLPGAAAGVIQVLTLMWIRTVINYQYRYGTTFHQAVKTLLNQGGIRRFYRGVGFALIQNPLAKFGSTAANDGMEVLLSHFRMTQSWGPGRRTIISSIVVAVWRMILMPIDTCKTVLQVDSTEGFRDLIRKVRMGKIQVLYEGAIANALASALSYYPWFYMYNILSKSQALENAVRWPLMRNAVIGFLASVVSDTATNFIRVIKTTKQTVARKHNVGYGEAISMILAADGVKVSEAVCFRSDLMLLR